MPNINSSTFKNSKGFKDSKKNPFVPFFIIVVLALAALMVQYWVMDVNQKMYDQIQQQEQQQQESQQEQQQQESQQEQQQQESRQEQ